MIWLHTLEKWFLTFSLSRLPTVCNRPLFQVLRTLNKLLKRMYLLVNLVIKLAML